MADLLDFLPPETILPRVRAASRKAVLSELAEAAARHYRLNSLDVFDNVMERERLGSTGVGEGVAIPHARVQGLTKICGAFARLETPVDFEAIDEAPCDLIFMLLAPENVGNDHLRALARVSRVMRQEDLRQKLRLAMSVDEIITCFAAPAGSENNAA